MRSWLLVTVAVVVLTACTDAAILDPDPATQGETAGNTAPFCRAWPDTRRTLVNTFEGEERRLENYQSAVSLDEAMEQYDRSVPTEIRDHWNVAYDAYVRASDLTFTIGIVRADHVKMMFGAAGPDPVFARAMDGIEAIDEWSITACGDFCSRWPALRDAVVLDPGHSYIDGEPERVEREIGRMEAAIRAGDKLVPPALADEWEFAATLKSEFLLLWREYGRDSLHGERGDEVFRGRVGMESIDAFDASLAAVETMATWVDANCDPASLTGGALGTLSVRIWPHADLIGRMILLVLLPIGAEFGAVENSNDYLGAWCTEQPQSAEEFEREVARQARESGRDPQEIINEWMQPESLRPVEQVTGNTHVASVCHNLRHEDEIVVLGGSYELFAGTFIGEPGSYTLHFGAPERCGQMTVAVDGDTVVNLPALEECDLEPIGRPEEIVRRTVLPFEPGGTLRIELPSALAPEEFAGCGLSAVLLPAGTTLNDIGRGDTWPIGGLRAHLSSSRQLGDPAASRVGNESGLAPILAVGSTGSPSQLHLQIDGNRAWDASLPDPVPLAAGSYDLILQEQCLRDEHVDDPEEEDFYTTCASVTVEVDGDTVVTLPEFGACR